MVISQDDSSADSGSLKYKVGVPRALYYYKFFPFWHEMLTQMGCQVILSPETNKQILEAGSKFSLGELCVPVKAYFGHVLWLLENRQDLDYLFIPRYVSLHKDHYFCPKFLALPDTVKNTVKPDIPILEWEINAKKRANIDSAIQFGKKLGISQEKSGKAYAKGMTRFKQFKDMQQKGHLFPDVMHRMYPQYVKKPKKMKKLDGDEQVDMNYPIKLLVLGHPYNTYDSLINLNLIERLQKYHVEVELLEQINENAFDDYVTINEKFHNYWNMEEELLQAARYYLLNENHDVDGVIFLISFACGPDSLIQELIMRDFKKVKMPFLDLILDEHSGESGMVTRIESFIDMIRRRKYQNMLSK